MEYQKHKCCGSVCECFQINRKISLEKVMLKISKSKKSTRHHRVFATCMAKRFGTWMKRLSVLNKQEKWAELLTNAVPRTGPPPLRNTIRIFQRSTINDQRSTINDQRSTRNTFRIFRQELIGHQDISRIIKFPTVHGVRGVINAPPSARKRNYVHELIHRENQTKSISI